MTNLSPAAERAMWLIADTCPEVTPAHAHRVAETMDRRGWLAPPLPGPSTTIADDDLNADVWHEGTWSISTATDHMPGKVAIQDTEPGGILYVEPEAARNLAHQLLAAAASAESKGLGS